jgi:hypothetical protein
MASYEEGKLRKALVHGTTVPHEHLWSRQIHRHRSKHPRTPLVLGVLVTREDSCSYDLSDSIVALN